MTHWHVVPLMTPLQQLFELPQLKPPRGMQPEKLHRQMPALHTSGGLDEQHGVDVPQPWLKPAQGLVAVTVVPASP